MEINEIRRLLEHSGIKVHDIKDGFIYFEDPSCIYTAFDTILNVAWVVILVLTAIMLFGWALLYIKNGTKINDVFNNAKTIILIFCVLSVTKPIVNVIYRDNIFSSGCEIKQASLTNVQELVEMRTKALSGANDVSSYEIFDMVDSGPVGISEPDYESISEEAENLANRIDNFLDSESEENRNDMGNADAISAQSTYNVKSRIGDNSGGFTYTDDTEINETFSEQNATNANSSLSYDPNSFVRIEYRKGVTIYINARGEKIKRTGGSASWRNNNPGNIRKSAVAREFGAIGATDSWAVFKSEEDGLKAIMRLLRSKNYKNLSIKAAIYRWCPFGDGKNNPIYYSQKISKMTGLPANATINSLNNAQLRKVANAIKHQEGWTIGKEEKL